jgi:CubicO group peptidase (beta-lactamase class C family)
MLERFLNIVCQRIKRGGYRLINDPFNMVRGLVVLSLLFSLSFLSYNSVNSRSSGPDLSSIELEEVKAYHFSEEELGFYEDEITNLLLRNRFNGQIFVARHGTILYNRCFGFSDFRTSTALTHETPFQLASISKTFTATAVLLLHQEEKLHVDSLVVNYIPEFPYPRITVRHLLSHTSGLQNYMWVMERSWTQARMPNNEDMLATFIRQRRPLDFVPGTRWAYSNTGYAMLGLLVERVSGQKFPDFMRERIFDPLGMTNTFVYDVHGDVLPENRAFGFNPNRSRFSYIPDVRHDGVMGDKGIFSTAGDLYKWDQAIYRNQLLTAELWEQAFEKARLQNNNTVNYGMGWRLQTFMDHRIVHHPGRWNGFRTSFKRFIDDDATLIILTNTNRNIAGLVDEMQKIIFHKELTMVPESALPLEEENGVMNNGVN